MTGFILLSRDLLENDIWRMNSDLVRLWIYLLCKVSYGKKEFTYSRGTTKITVRKGEFLRSLRRISDDCSYTGNNKLVSWSTSRVAAMLKTLEDDGRIEILSNSTLGTHLRLSNYEAYQSFAAYKGDRLRTDAAQMQHKSKAIESNKKETDALWGIYLEELSPKPPHPRLTSKRRSVLMSLYNEQLTKQNGTDPMALFRKVLKAVKGSSHHMGTRAYHLPESLFRNEERRESWTHRALAKAKATNITPTVSRDWSVEQ